MFQKIQFFDLQKYVIFKPGESSTFYQRVESHKFL